MSERVFERANERDGALAHWCTIAASDASQEWLVHR